MIRCPIASARHMYGSRPIGTTGANKTRPRPGGSGSKVEIGPLMANEQNSPAIPLNGAANQCGGAKHRRIKVIFACHSCGATYEASQDHEKSMGRFDCTSCGATVHTWAGYYNFTDWMQAWHREIGESFSTSLDPATLSRVRLNAHSDLSNY